MTEHCTYQWRRGRSPAGPQCCLPRGHEDAHRYKCAAQHCPGYEYPASFVPHTGCAELVASEPKPKPKRTDMVVVTGCGNCPFAGPDPFAGDPYAGGHGGPCTHPAREDRKLVNARQATIPDHCPLSQNAVMVATYPFNWSEW